MDDRIALERITVEEQIYRHLRRMIFSGELGAGQRIVQDQLAREFGVSRIPVRGALRTLEGTGLIRKDRNGALTVASFAARDFEEITALRELMEPAAARAAVQHVTDADLAELESINDALNSAIESGRRDLIHSLNTRFHLKIYGMCGNARMVEMIQGLWASRANLGNSKTRAEGNRSVEEHRAMIEALRQRDSDLIAELITRHVLISREKWAAVNELQSLASSAPE